MSTIQIVTGAGIHLPYEEKQVHDMLRQGLLTPETLYWKEGMTEWRPLKELPGAAPGSLAHPAAAPRYQFTKNPEPLATVVKVMLVISLLAAIPHLFLGIAMLIETFLQDFKSLALEARWIQYLAYGSMVVFLLTAIPFLMWIYRANLNCRGFGAQLKFSPGLAAGSYFIPFANLVFPCQSMQEIWKASRNPAQWQTEGSSVLVGFWWAFWLIHGVLGQVLLFFSKSHHGDSLSIITLKLQTISVLLIVLEISKIILCGLAFAVIHVITTRQKKLTEPPLPGISAGPLFK